MTWRTVADRILRESDCGTIGTLGPIASEADPERSGGFAVPLDSVRALNTWSKGLVSVDPRQPIEGYSASAWWTLCEDAAWLFRSFGEQAAHDGWSCADLFGILPGKPHWGGIADRLQGSRSLLLTPDRAHWRGWGQVGRFNRGSYPELMVVWETSP